MLSRSYIKLEYRVMVVTSCETVQLCCFLVNMGVNVSRSTHLHRANNNVMQIAKTSVFHEQTKHIKIYCHFTCHHLHIGSISLPFVPSTLQIVDIFTKARQSLGFNYCPMNFQYLLLSSLKKFN